MDFMHMAALLRFMNLNAKSSREKILSSFDARRWRQDSNKDDFAQSPIQYPKTLVFGHGNKTEM